MILFHQSASVVSKNVQLENGINTDLLRDFNKSQIWRKSIEKITANSIRYRYR